MELKNELVGGVAVVVAKERESVCVCVSVSIFNSLSKSLFTSSK